MGGIGSSSGGGGKRKHGRLLRKPAHKRYMSESRWMKNKIRKLKKHIKKHEKDKTAIAALKNVGLERR